MLTHRMIDGLIGFHGVKRLNDDYKPFLNIFSFVDFHITKKGWKCFDHIEYSGWA